MAESSDPAADGTAAHPVTATGESDEQLQDLRHVETPLPEAERKRQRARRLVSFGTFTVLYFCALAFCVSDRRVTAGVRDGLISEIFPDTGVTMYRSKVGQEMIRATGTAEIMNAGEVAGLLAAVTSFCANRAGTDKVLKSSWTCSMVNLRITEPGYTVWDPVENRRLATQAIDNWKRELHFDNGSKVEHYRGLFKRTWDPRIKAEAERRNRTMVELCSPLFLGNHVELGDDPYGETGRKPVGFNNLAEFKENYMGNGTGIEGLSEDFDEPRGTSMDDVAARTDKIEAQQEELLTLLKAVARHQNIPGLDLMEVGKHAHKRSASLTESSPASQTKAEGPTHPESIAKHTAVKDKDGVSAFEMGEDFVEVSPNDEPVSSTEKQHSEQGKLNIGSKGYTKIRKARKADDKYAQGCWQTADISGTLLDAWAKYDNDIDLKLSKADFLKLTREYFRQKFVQSGKIEAFVAKKEEFSLDDFLDLTKDNMNDLTIPSRGFLTIKCRNHHFGLIALCKPKQVSVTYQIQNLVTYPDGVTDNHGELILDMNFKAVDGGYDDGWYYPPSGWYQVDVSIDSMAGLGQQTKLSFFFTITAVLAAILAVLVDAVPTMLMAPINIWKFLTLRFSKGQDFEEVCQVLVPRFMRVFDARGGRSKFLGTAAIMQEDLIAFLLLICWGNCLHQAFFDFSVLPNGEMNEACVIAYLEQGRQWIKHTITGDTKYYAPGRGLPIMTYMNLCQSWEARWQYYAELFNQLFFQVHCMGVSHGVVLGLCMFRMVELFDFLPGLSWLHLTARLAISKIMIFVFVLMFLVFSFSMAMYVQFGDLYSQYSTVSKSFCTVALASVGMSGRATEDVKSFVEWSGSLVYMYIFTFQLLIGIVAMNVFITIVQNAYNAATHPEEAIRASEESDTRRIMFLAHMMGWHPGDHDEHFEKRMAHG